MNTFKSIDDLLRVLEREKVLMKQMFQKRPSTSLKYDYALELTEYKDYAPLEITMTGETDTETGAQIATTEQTRSIPEGQLYVGAKCKVNGNFYFSRIMEDANKEYPIHINSENGGALGWVKASSLTVVSDK